MVSMGRYHSLISQTFPDSLIHIPLLTHTFPEVMLSVVNKTKADFVYREKEVVCFEKWYTSLTKNSFRHSQCWLLEERLLVIVIQKVFLIIIFQKDIDMLR